MTPEQARVREFNEQAGATVNEWPTLPSEADRRLRYGLIAEELNEFGKASEAENLVAVADALADLLYVVYGAGVTYGIDLEPIFDEVHRSNMAKGQPCAPCLGIGSFEVVEGVLEDCEDCGGTGRVFVKRADGKILKASDWQSPRLAAIIEEQARVR